MKRFSDVKCFRDVSAERRFYGGNYDTELVGVFRVEIGVGRGKMLIVASAATDRLPWNHVSVSTKTRCPTWGEMCRVKDLFFDDDETVMQLHPPKSEYVNNHKYCLHLWQPVGLGLVIPMPPSIMVGAKEFGVLNK